MSLFFFLITLCVLIKMESFTGFVYCSCVCKVSKGWPKYDTEVSIEIECTTNESATSNSVVPLTFNKIEGKTVCLSRKMAYKSSTINPDKSPAPFDNSLFIKLSNTLKKAFYTLYSTHTNYMPFRNNMIIHLHL